MISIIIPIYNPGDMLRNCLDSIVNQSYRDIEIICINDGSTDNSADILSEYAEKDKRIIIINQSNQGVSAARNRGLEIASGDYLSFIDSDDELDLQMYEILIGLINDNEYKFDIAHCGYRRIKPDGSTVDINGTDKRYVHNRDDALRHFISGTLFNGGLWNKLFRRNLFDDIRFLTELKINEDVLVCFQAFFKSKHTVFYDKPLYFYNENPKSTCSTTKHLNKALDCVKASKIIYQTCLNTDLHICAAERYYHALCGAYRAYIFDNIKASTHERKKLSSVIDELKKRKLPISVKHKFNYMFMRHAPVLYRTLYQCYNSIRVPNWDVK